MKNKGQNIVEFVIILALIAVVCIFALSILGGNTNFLFSSSQDKVANFDPMNTKGLKLINPKAKSTTPITPVSGTEKIGSYDVDFHEDGSASFNVGDQVVILPQNAVDLANKVFQTTGSSGLTDIVNEIAQMIQQHQIDYPGQAVPIEISYGKSKRGLYGETFIGTAEVNSVQLKVDDHVVIIANDHSCLENTVDDDCNAVMDRFGQYKLDATIDQTGKITGKIYTDILSMNDQAYSGTIQANGSILGSFDFGGDDNGGPGENVGNWDFDLSNPDYQFNP